MKSYDVAIIGAGIAGSSLAWRIAKKRSTLIVEMESAAGYHASGRSAAQFVTLIGNQLMAAACAASRQLLSSPPSGFSPILQHRGNLFIAHADKAEAFERFVDEHRANHTLERWSIDQLVERVPFIRREWVAHAVYLDDCWDIDTNALLQGYLRAARADGATLKTHAELHEAVWHNDHWTLTIGGETVRAGVVVNAAGAWSDEVAERASVVPFPIMPKRRSAVTVDLPAGVDIEAIPFTDELDEDFYFRPESGGLMISPANEDDDVAADVQPDELDIAWAMHHLETVTTLTPARPRSAWAGLRSFSADRLPVIGADPANPGFFWLVGQGGTGVMTSPALSHYAAALLLDEAHPQSLADVGVPAGAFAPDRVALKR
ncbi:FAD-dependent oxidoreductase [Gammaproteobacteria bacterium]|nr:FAD-dependent oxidoreductase [Gammaproteobacteria bacterium]